VKVVSLDESTPVGTVAELALKTGQFVTQASVVQAETGGAPAVPTLSCEKT
jgi:hypothetical protein